MKEQRRKGWEEWQRLLLRRLSVDKQKGKPGELGARDASFSPCQLMER